MQYRLKLRLAPTSHRFSGCVCVCYQAVLEADNARLVVTIDIGNDHTVHPYDKWTLASRCAFLCL